MNGNTIEIVAPTDAHRADWCRLYDGYATFYKREMTDEIAGNVWQWLQDPSHVLTGALAVREGEVLGLAHYRAMPSPLRGAEVGFLDDLFVDPAARGSGVVQVLFDHLRDVAETNGWGVIRWLTADDNYRARSIYDRVAKKGVWNVYEMFL